MRKKQAAVCYKNKGPTSGDSLTTPDAFANNRAASLYFPNTLSTDVDMSTFRIRVRNLFLPKVLAK